MKRIAMAAALVSTLATPLLAAEDRVLDFPKDYQKDFTLYFTGDRFIAEEQTIRIFANSIALEGVRKDGKLPDGSVLVAELYAAKGDLDGKPVSLRGKVVKFSKGILGRNWIHLRDGSGDAATGTHDITVTTSGTAAVGDIVVIEGIVGLDRDFGSGYRYAVIVEEAKVSKSL